MFAWIRRWIGGQSSTSGATTSPVGVSATAAHEPPMPFIVGVPRSGTTLLRLMLDAHPLLAIPPETGFLSIAAQMPPDSRAAREAFASALVAFPPDAPAWGDFGIAEDAFRDRLYQLDSFTPADGFRLFYRMYAARFGKPRYGDKTPLYAQQLVSIESILPEARFIHLLRDGRDVAISLRRQWFSPGESIETQARYWRDVIVAARVQGRQVRNYLEVRYEDLLRDPAIVLGRIAAFTDLPFHDAMLRHHEFAAERLAEHGERRRPDQSIVVTREQRAAQQRTTRGPLDDRWIGGWREKLSADEQARYLSVAGELLAELGYE